MKDTLDSVVCPECGKTNKLKQTFECRICRRVHLCGDHLDREFFCCEICAETERTRFEVPTLIVPNDGFSTDESKPRFGWNQTIGAEGYDLQIAASCETLDDVAITEVQECTVRFPDLLKPGDYHWRVRAKAGLAHTPWTFPRNLHIENAKYQVGGVGPAGGIVIFNKGFSEDGWRFLEVAPEATENTKQSWGERGRRVDGTELCMGSGLENTLRIVAAHGNPGISPGTEGFAALTCRCLTFGGYLDWFLPSKDELALLFRYQGRQHALAYSSGGYWSSSEDDADYAWAQFFVDWYGSQLEYRKDSFLQVRAMRRF